LVQFWLRSNAVSHVLIISPCWAWWWLLIIQRRKISQRIDERIANCCTSAKRSQSDQFRNRVRGRILSETSSLEGRVRCHHLWKPLKTKNMLILPNSRPLPSFPHPHLKITSLRCLRLTRLNALRFLPRSPWWFQPIQHKNTIPRKDKICNMP